MQSHPWAVMIETVNTVVTQAAVRGSRWSKDLTRETIFQLNGLSADKNLFRSWWWSICWAVEGVWNFDLLLDVSCFILRCSWYDSDKVHEVKACPRTVRLMNLPRIAE